LDKVRKDGAVPGLLDGLALPHPRPDVAV